MSTGRNAFSCLSDSVQSPAQKIYTFSPFRNIPDTTRQLSAAILEEKDRRKGFSMAERRGIMKGKKKHDRGYRKLLSHPKVVEDLISTFVDEDFARLIDFSKLAPYNSSFITESHEERETDMIWSVEVKGRPVFFYILIEFQSTIDRWMALRMLVYILLLYQDLIVKKIVKKKLPSVLPIVLYRGKRPWKAPVKLQDLVEVPFEAFRPHVPEFSYLKIEEQGFSKESLLALESIMAKVFLMETVSLEDLVEISRSFQEIYRKEIDGELKNILKKWFESKLSMIGLDAEGIDLDEGEVETMFETNVRKFKAQMKKEGKIEGKLEGKLETAAAMFKKGYDRETVKQLTGLSDEELSRLKKDE
jgi:predicted transposase/invertase (TIGR01784 family)